MDTPKISLFLAHFDHDILLASLEEGDVVVLDAGLVVGLRLEDAAVRVVAQAAAPPQLLLDPEHPVVVLLRLFLGEQTNQSCFMIVQGDPSRQ